MKKWYSNHKWPLAGTAAGILAGFLYWYFVGCASGTCMITSKPLNSMLYGAAVGWLLFPALFEKNKKIDNDVQ